MSAFLVLGQGIAGGRSLGIAQMSPLERKRELCLKRRR
jgi:hypothetical protein